MAVLWFYVWLSFHKLAHNGLQICDVANLETGTFILLPIVDRSRMFQLPLSPPYSKMSCYGLVVIIKEA
jgi:hypothetical protein